MILTRESRRNRWLVMLVVWALIGLFATLHVFALRDYAALLDRSAQRVPPVTTPMQHIILTSSADTQTWLRYALAIDEGAPWRVRFTHDDNAPAGREVHWSSGFTQLVALAGRLRAVFTGESLTLATQRMIPWFNLPLLLVVIVVFSGWIARRAGAGAGVLAALGLMGAESFYGAFQPLYVDHHGILAVASLGLVLGAVFMGGGWWRPQAGPDGLLPVSRASARSAAVFSAVSGAIGMWFSAASTIPGIALTGLAGLLAAWALGRAARREGAEFDAGLWRLWGRVGAAGSLFFYFWEYAPHHLGLRLEVNHPLFALAWWGGSEIVAQLAERHISPANGGIPRPPLWRRLWPYAAICVAPLTILIAGTRVFVVADPFVSEVPKVVTEGLSLAAYTKALGWPMFFQLVNWNVVPLAVVVILLFRKARRDRVLLFFAAVVAFGFLVLLISQVRWSYGASGPFLTLLLVATVAVTQRRGTQMRWLAVIGIGLACFAPAAISRVREIRYRVAARMPDRADFQQLIYRDAAAAIRASQPSGDIVLLASPNASTGMGYYGKFQTIGTLYWENYAGMRTAAEIFCATSAEQARELIRQHGITHIAMISEANFLREFFTVLRPAGTFEEFRQTFGCQLLYDQKLPLWLRPIPYRVPADAAALPDLHVLLLQVVPEQSDSEGLWHVALAQFALGEVANAAQNLEVAILRAPESQRVLLCTNAGNICYANGAQAAAVRFYRAALTAREDPVVSGNLVWVLATSSDPSVRNGGEALAIAKQLPANDPLALNALAAAFAETGDFPAAVSAASRAYDLIVAAGNPSTAAVFAARLEAYRAGKPWRQ